ncbi:MAG: family 20 glycosylhydrolase [Bacteroidaceae bacterium]|nr:family 20 glycosylhydrolase [Bacteroidaceae bacterium]
MKILRNIVAACAALALSLSAHASVDNLLPKPVSVTASNAGDFAKGGEVALTDPTASVMLQEFADICGYTVSATAMRAIEVQLVTSIPGAEDYELKGFENEAYAISVSTDKITVKAVTRTGVLRAAATLMQLAEGATAIPSVEIIDWPAFKLRGFMHDVGRSFVSLEELEKEIKLYARFKVNCFHWHLTESQAWRFEVKQYPQLTDASSMTRFAGKYYTQEECKEIDKLCHDYGVVLIPEIDMPGHSGAFERAMGHSMQTAQGVTELQNILEEVADVFTYAPYIHIGADEVSITYTNFLQTMLKKVHDLGKYTTTWNPISGQNVAAYDVDLCQLWSSSGKLISGKANIDCRYNYSNHFDVFADLAGIYLSQIYYAKKGNPEIAGEISCPWNDRKTPTQEDIIKQNNVWANTLASATRAWIGGGEGYIETQGAVIPNSGAQYEDFADWERRFLFWKSSWLAAELIPYVQQTNIRWRLTDMMANGNNASTVLPPETEGPKESYEFNGNVVNTRIVTGGGIYLRHTWGSAVPCVFGAPAEGNTAYAWTYVYSETEQDAAALIEFQNYGRSEKDPAPAKGNWDRKGSRVWLNDVELIAPDWKNAGVSITNEVDLLDENFTARDPYPVHLQAGWNKIFLKLPYVSSGCRLNKWMWTFVLTTPDGKHALDGLRYSPDKTMDAAAEEVQMLLSDILADVNSKVSDRIGYYRKDSAASLLALIDEVRATLGDSMTAAERQVQKDALNAAYADFLAHYKEGGINLPKESTATDEYWYSLQSKRGSRYATSTGSGANVTGMTAISENAYWKFMKREDGTFNIVGRSGLFISPASANNTSLKAVADEPSAGWEIKQSAAEGYVIIVCGTTAQFNQTNNSSLGFNVYNWGGGTNTTDDGCQYLIADAPKLPVSEVKYSTDEKSYYYNMYTPNRDNRYPTSYGDQAVLMGDGSISTASAWKFVKRSDDTVDIINYSDGCYISPASAYNSALMTVAEQPEAGWTLMRSGNYFIIYSGTTAQFNQTNSGLGYKIYNWGNQGTPNTTDTGCQYYFVEADVPEPTPTAVEAIAAADGAGTQYFTLSGHRLAAITRPGVYVIRKDGESRKLVVK